MMNRSLYLKGLEAVAPKRSGAPNDLAPSPDHSGVFPMDTRLFTDIATMSRPARAAVAPTIATLKSDHPSSDSGMSALYARRHISRRV